MMRNITFYSKPMLCLLIVLSLNACTTLTAIHRADNITWNTPYLSQAECPNLDGKYEDRGLLDKFFMRLVGSFQVNVDAGAYEGTQYARTAHAERYETFPYRTQNGGIVRFSSRDVDFHARLTHFPIEC